MRVLLYPKVIRYYTTGFYLSPPPPHTSLSLSLSLSLPPSLPPSLPLSLRRAALELWKQRHRSDATYNNLIEVFERAGYKNLTDVVRKTAGNSLSLALSGMETPSVSDSYVICVHVRR